MSNDNQDFLNILKGINKETMQKYYVIRNSDGDTHVTEYTKENLERDIDNKDWGEVEFLSARYVCSYQQPTYENCSCGGYNAITEEDD